VGFIELTTPFMHLKSRNTVFDAEFSDPETGVSWPKWDSVNRKENLHRIVRISRVVVHPEMRGLRLSKVLLKAAMKFSKQRWHVGGQRPLFIEITADMLKYVPFVAGSGFAYLGESEGNAKRVLRDMKYLSEIRAIPEKEREPHSVVDGSGKGILSRQKRDLGIFTDLAGRLGEDNASEAVSQAAEGIFGNPEIVDELLRLIRSPKPVYMAGLNSSASGFLTQRVNTLNITRIPSVSTRNKLAASGSLRVEHLSIAFTPDNFDSLESDAISVRRAFGISGSQTYTTGVRDLSFEVSRGQIALIIGASGTGKTSLLQALAGKDIDGDISGEVKIPDDAHIDDLTRSFPDGPLITSLGAPDLSQALRILGSVGLAEPRLYLASFLELSAGQKYRARLAQLLCSNADIWLLDEFGSNLDDASFTAMAKTFVARARESGSIVILASVRRKPVEDLVDADVTVYLDQIGTPQIQKR